MFHTEFVGVVMICLHTKFHMPDNCSSLLIITIKPKTKHRLHEAAMSFYILQKKLP
jgi:hypothetical protein